jgi:hypothetical protein
MKATFTELARNRVVVEYLNCVGEKVRKEYYTQYLKGGQVLIESPDVNNAVCKALKRRGDKLVWNPKTSTFCNLIKTEQSRANKLEGKLALYGALGGY